MPMTANGWRVRVDDRREAADVERVLRERRVSLVGLRLAVCVARQERTDSSANPELRRVAVEAQIAILRHALGMADLALVRRAARTLRVRDLAGESSAIEALLAVVRDARSAPEEILDAAAQLAGLAPA